VCDLETSRICAPYIYIYIYIYDISSLRVNVSWREGIVYTQWDVKIAHLFIHVISAIFITPATVLKQ